MNAGRWILASMLAVVGVYAAALGQSQGVRQLVVPKNAEVSIAMSTAVDHSAYNSIQNAMQHIFVAEQSRLYTLANEDATLSHDVQRNVIDGAILTCNLYIRAMLSPSQQTAHDRDVLQVQTYKPGGAWKRVLSQKSVVKELLALSPEQEKKIQGLIDKYLVGWSDAAMKKGATHAQKQALHERNALRLAKAVREELTREQLTEFNTLMNGFNREMAAIAGPYRVAKF
jgi:hypothetical protein